MHSWADEILTSGDGFLFSETSDHTPSWCSPQPYWKLRALWTSTTCSCQCKYNMMHSFKTPEHTRQQVDSTSGTQISLKFPQGENRNINEFNRCRIPPIFHLPVREKTVASDSAICNWPGFANARRSIGHGKPQWRRSSPLGSVNWYYFGKSIGSLLLLQAVTRAAYNHPSWSAGSVRAITVDSADLSLLGLC